MQMAAENRSADSRDLGRRRRIVIVDLVPGLTRDIIEKLAARIELELVIAITVSNDFRDMPFVRWHDLNTIHFGDYAAADIAPSTQSILSRMAPYESMALRCFDKLDKITDTRVMRETELSGSDLLSARRAVDVSHSERRAIYYAMSGIGLRF